MKKNNIFRLVITLTIIGMISGTFLAFVFRWTIPYINEHEIEARQQALSSVLPGAEEFKEVEKDGELFYEGYDETGNKIGVALKTSGSGFQGEIEIMVGTDPRAKKIFGINILNHQETPGLGARINEEDFKNNFEDIPFGEYEVIKAKPDNEYEIEAIAGATVSSESVTRIVETAVADIKNIYGGAE